MLQGLVSKRFLCSQALKASGLELAAVEAMKNLIFAVASVGLVIR